LPVAYVGHKNVPQIIGGRQISDLNIGTENDVGAECGAQSVSAGGACDAKTEIPGAVPLKTPVCAAKVCPGLFWG
jgi:hypothetical protein